MTRQKKSKKINVMLKKKKLTRYELDQKALEKKKKKKVGLTKGNRFNPITIEEKNKLDNINNSKINTLDPKVGSKNKIDLYSSSKKCNIQIKDINTKAKLEEFVIKDGKLKNNARKKSHKSFNSILPKNEKINFRSKLEKAENTINNKQNNIDQVVLAELLVKKIKLKTSSK